jgi:hypothetical protein
MRHLSFPTCQMLSLIVWRRVIQITLRYIRLILAFVCLLMRDYAETGDGGARRHYRQRRAV